MAMKKSELRELYLMMFPEYPDIVNITQLQAENRYAEFRYPLSCGDLSGFEVCDENRHGTAECCYEGG